jgi:3-hydroxyacyl-CoA dehydrogenase
MKNNTTVERVSIVGAGAMGRDIALSYALYDNKIKIYDISQNSLEQAKESNASNLKLLLETGLITEDRLQKIRDNISYSSSLEETLDNPDFVTEAVPETLQLKKETFSKIEDHIGESTPIATNTSGLSVTEIASVVENEKRVLGTHWFNPAYIVPVVEVIHGKKTSDSVVNMVYNLLKSIDKTPVIVKKDIPGFIANRIQMAMAYEAFSLLDRGVADAKDIDRAIKGSFGFRLPILGIFEKLDHSGLDIHRDVISYLLDDLDRGTDPKPLLLDKVERGEIGLKSGKGIYDWELGDPQKIKNTRDRKLLSLLQSFNEDDFMSGSHTDSEDN